MEDYRKLIEALSDKAVGIGTIENVQAALRAAVKMDSPLKDWLLGDICVIWNVMPVQEPATDSHSEFDAQDKSETTPEQYIAIQHAIAKEHAGKYVVITGNRLVCATYDEREAVNSFSQERINEPPMPIGFFPPDYDYSGNPVEAQVFSRGRSKV